MKYMLFIYMIKKRIKTIIKKTKLKKTKIKKIKKSPNNSIINNISIEKIDEIIDRILKDENVNIYGLPDSYERKLYKKLFLIVFKLIDETLKTTTVDILGHKIKFTLHK